MKAVLARKTAARGISFVGHGHDEIAKGTVSPCKADDFAHLRLLFACAEKLEAGDDAGRSGPCFQIEKQH
jgi:hypothetical protein